MLKYRKSWSGALALAVAFAATGCDDDGPAAPGTQVPSEEEATLSGDIEGERRLSADTTYTLRGLVTVLEGAELHIEPGTLILGDADVSPSALFIRQGAKIFADGTADAPIVFTSSRPAGQRTRGDWGGVVINGYSYCNFPEGECIGEGRSGPYGGNDPDDDSGRLTYVRIEYAGYEVSLGNELNALTLNGVGSGTEIHHIQTHYGSDDGIELFGGTVDIKYALSTGISDDSFDYSTGWQGRGQFWIAQQDPDDADTGFEVDGNEEDYEATPWTDPVIYNVTLIGKGPDGLGGTPGESTSGLKLRRGTAGELRNFIVMGFGDDGLNIDNEATYDRCDSGDLVVGNSIFHENAAFHSSDDEAACTALPGWSLRTLDPQLGAPYDRQNPDFRPAPGSPATEDFASAPTDGFFESVDYLGAVDPNGPEWYLGWTTWETS